MFMSTLSVMYWPLLAVVWSDLKTWRRVEKEGRSLGNAAQHLSIIPCLDGEKRRDREGHACVLECCMFIMTRNTESLTGR